jgi:uncharacterized spore protein YtfJ
MAEETSKAQDPTQAVEMVENTMERFFEGANVKNVFGRPVQHGDTTIIPAAEITVVGGFGVGVGVGISPKRMEGQQESEGSGSGGGGAGTTLARPVAVVIASPDGVRVEPVIDLTKIGLAVITAWGFMIAQIVKMRRKR